MIGLPGKYKMNLIRNSSDTEVDFDREYWAKIPVIYKGKTALEHVREILNKFVNLNYAHQTRIAETKKFRWAYSRQQNWHSTMQQRVLFGEEIVNNLKEFEKRQRVDNYKNRKRDGVIC